ncbi:hypothetical protein BDZ91DRAFT_155385 [Kalaharituber pfeilii]|nr:hypothetical protein BDZ91DRAFT_155385 [Kalaharituber pfeilii]
MYPSDTGFMYLTRTYIYNIQVPTLTSTTTSTYAMSTATKVTYIGTFGFTQCMPKSKPISIEIPYIYLKILSPKPYLIATYLTIRELSHSKLLYKPTFFFFFFSVETHIYLPIFFVYACIPHERKWKKSNTQQTHNKYTKQTAQILRVKRGYLTFPAPPSPSPPSATQFKEVNKQKLRRKTKNNNFYISRDTPYLPSYE